MGTTSGVLDALLDWQDEEVDLVELGLENDIGPVGQNDTERSVSLTIIRRDETSGRWVFGQEVQAIEDTVWRALPRREHTHLSINDDRTFRRTEYTFDKEYLRSKHVRLAATMIMADMPPDQAMVFRAPLQVAGVKQGVENLPESYDLELAGHIKAGLNPLSFNMQDHPERRAQSDLEAIATISFAPRDIYLTEPSEYRASFASDLVSNAVFPYRPTQAASRWFLSRGSNHAKRVQRLGLVNVPFNEIAKVHGEIVKDLWPKSEFWLNAIDRQQYVSIARHRRLFVEKLAGHVDYAVKLAVWQALAGVDPAKRIGEGDEVVTLAARYLEHHLRVWNDALKRQSEKGADIDPAVEMASQEHFEVERAMHLIAAAPDRSAELRAQINALQAGYLQLDTDFVEETIRKLQGELDALS